MADLSRYRAVLFCTAALVSSPVHAADVTVLRQGFCVTKSDSGCGEVILPGTMIDFARLPKGPDGKPVIYFYSVQKTTGKATFVQIVQSDEAENNVDYQPLAGGGAQPADLKPALKALIKKLAPEGGVVVTPFRTNAADDKVIAMSAIAVSGPGVFHASVVDLKGNLIPVSTPISIDVRQSSR
jgi:hypothetical protein